MLSPILKYIHTFSWRIFVLLGILSNLIRGKKEKLLTTGKFKRIMCCGELWGVEK
jgi:hypothetical protein